ncbi:MAG: 2-hydroxyacyl-CoA dehydratase family protein [candidate division WOR-3 bacterium]|nr:2-hydroxyacyl-CoA dehydratase family protein [candidate division WOR-3 bacterium]
MRIGYFCLYTPIELLKALSLKPIRLIPSQKFDLTSKYFRYDACPFLKNLFSNLINKSWKTDGIFLLSLCDGQRRLGEILKREIPNLKVYEIYFPRTYNFSAFKLYYEEMLNFIKTFEKDLNLINKRLKEEVKILNQKKKDLIKVVNNLNFLDKAEIIKNFWEKGEIPSLNFLKPRIIEKEKILLLGSYFTPLDWSVINMIERYFTIVADSFCTVSRGIDFYPPVSNLKNYLFFYFSKIPCILRRPNRNFYNYLKRKIRKYEIKKIILYSLKFCDNFSFEKESLKSFLRLPVLNIESDYSEVNTLQMETRIAAFYES